MPTAATTEAAVNSTFRSVYLLWQVLGESPRALVKEACNTVVEDVKKPPLSRNNLAQPAITTQAAIVGLSRDDVQAGIISRMVAQFARNKSKPAPTASDFVAVVTALIAVKLIEKAYTAEMLQLMNEKEKDSLKTLLTTLRTKNTYDEDLRVAMVSMKAKHPLKVSKVPGTQISPDPKSEYSIVRSDHWVMTDLPNSLIQFLQKHSPMPIQRDAEQTKEISNIRVDQVIHIQFFIQIRFITLINGCLSDVG
jgi:hypothetical protein